MLSAKIKIRLRTTKEDKRAHNKLDWTSFANNLTLQDKYKVKVRNRFETLSEESLDSNLQSRYDIFVQSIEDSTTKLVKKVKKKRQVWVLQTTYELIKKRDVVKMKLKQRPTAIAKANLKSLNEQVDKSFVNDNVKYLEGLIKEMQAKLSNYLRSTWEIVNQVSRKKKDRLLPRVKMKDGMNYDSLTELINDWRIYISDLLNVCSAHLDNTTMIPPAKRDLDIDTSPIKIEEILEAIKDLKLRKSAGGDLAVTPESLKYGGNWVAAQLCEIFNRIIAENESQR